ncbi:MAG: hypothetical protein KAS53_09250 [Candidatus Cloacimonetes bacterium]|nr:hypothetical protein [Candidatus Cloacimonadota bacterium]
MIMQLGIEITLSSFILITWAIVSLLDKTYDDQEKQKVLSVINKFSSFNSKELITRVYTYYLNLFDKIYRPWLKIIKIENSFKTNFNLILAHGNRFKRIFRIIVYVNIVFWGIFGILIDLFFLNGMDPISILQTLIIFSSFYFRSKHGYSLLRSVIISCTTVLVGIYIFYILDANTHFPAIISNPNSFIFMGLISRVFFLSLPFNIPADYISIIETRWILGKLKKHSSRKIVFYLLLDVLITASIFIILSLYVLFPTYIEDTNALTIRIAGWSQGTALIKNVYILFFIPFIMTFFSSILLYLFIFTSFFIRLLMKFVNILFNAKLLFHPPKYPLQFLGLAITIGLIIFYFIIRLISYALQLIV